MIVSGIGSIKRAHQHLLARTEDAIRQAEDVAGRHAIEQVDTNPTFKPRTGNLQRQTGYKLIKVGGRILRVFNKAAYAGAIDQGARPHVIAARRKQFLRFMGRNGNWVFRRSVNRPGNKPYKFLFKATQSAGRVLADTLHREMEQIAKDF